ncbi:hypothetical protein AB0E63_04945 [Kribbella sp. NPDC026596]|jgi:hypothetical protein|uniref:hypothetical protein n=1 Tax=Kribbella sp. NPDC026596 TaxID=3155122 RepID=UPI0033DDE1B2
MNGLQLTTPPLAGGPRPPAPTTGGPVNGAGAALYSLLHRLGLVTVGTPGHR